jgi:hypothetical protein
VNATTDQRSEVAPSVDQFLTRVRAHLADLSDDDRDELLDGLEADLSEQHAEGGSLPDPAAYAAELRAAAGLPASSKPVRVRTPRPPLKEQLAALPDTWRERWMELTGHNDHTRRTWAFLEAVRPAWWVLRAWVAVTLLDMLSGDWEYVTVVPSLGVALLGPALLVGATVVSVLVGQGRLWPGSGPDRTLLARLTLVGLNAFAVVVPLTFHYAGSHPFVQEAYVAPVRAVDDGHGQVLRTGRDVVRNIYAYDAGGKPLQGVQLYDQQGRPVAVAPWSSMGAGADRQVTCPWFNGATPLFNVFPLPQRSQRHGTCLKDVDPATAGVPGFHEAPLASVPPVTLPTTTP